MDGRQRDLLPLPRAHGCDAPRAGLSRGVRQRICKRAWIDKRSDEISWALNELGGVGAASPGGPGGEHTRAALSLIREAVTAAPLPKERPAPHEALSALLRTDARYGDSECAGNIAPFGSAPVSLPSRDLVGVDIYSVLPEPASHKLKRFRDTILLSDEEYALRIKNEGLPNLYFDPVLEAQPAKHANNTRHLGRTQNKRLLRRV